MSGPSLPALAGAVVPALAEPGRAAPGLAKMEFLSDFTKDS